MVSRWRGEVLTKLPGKARRIALTIDCGGSAAGLPSILATLRRHGVAATFFVTGEFARAHRSGVRRIVAAGHAIGNHTDTHPDLAQLSAHAIARQLTRAERAIVDAAATHARPWFRFPFGSYDGAALAEVNRLGYIALGWTVDSRGWQGTSGGQSRSAVRQRVLAAAEPGGIVLLHAGANPQDGSTLDADALPGIIRGLTERAYRFVTIPAALAR